MVVKSLSQTVFLLLVQNSTTTTVMPHKILVLSSLEQHLCFFIVYPSFLSCYATVVLIFSCLLSACRKKKSGTRSPKRTIYELDIHAPAGHLLLLFLSITWIRENTPSLSPKLLRNSSICGLQEFCAHLCESGGEHKLLIVTSELHV